MLDARFTVSDLSFRVAGERWEARGEDDFRRAADRVRLTLALLTPEKIEWVHATLASGRRHETIEMMCTNAALSVTPEAHGQAGPKLSLSVP